MQCLSAVMPLPTKLVGLSVALGPRPRASVSQSGSSFILMPLPTVLLYAPPLWFLVNHLSPLQHFSCQ
jgi:hypothetical protein